MVVLPLTLLTIFLSYLIFPSSEFIWLFVFFRDSLYAIETINFVILPLITILLALLSFLKINHKILFPFLLFLAFVVIIFFGSLLLNIRYFDATDFIFEDYHLFFFKLILFLMVIYSIFTAISGLSIILPLETVENSKKVFNINFIGIIILFSLSYGSFYQILKHFRVENDIVGLSGYYEDNAIIDLIDYYSDIEKEIHNNEIDYSLLKVQSLLYDESDDKSYSMSFDLSDELNELILNNKSSMLLSHVKSFVNEPNLTNRDLIDKHRAILLFLQSDEEQIKSFPIFKDVIQYSYNSLINIDTSDIKYKYVKLGTLAQFFSLTFNLEYLNIHQNMIKQYRKNIINEIIEVHPILGLYGFLEIVNTYQSLGKWHKSEKTMLESRYLFEKHFDISKVNLLENKILSFLADRIEDLLAKSVMIQGPKRDLAVELFDRSMEKDEGKQSDGLDYDYHVRFRHFYEVAIIAMSYLINDKASNPSEINEKLLKLIEKNKARSFNQSLDVEWITEIPLLEDNEAGINYLISDLVTIIQFYDSDTTINYANYNLNSSGITTKNLWKIAIRPGLINFYEPDESVELINQFRNTVIPPELQKRVKGKDLFISPDNYLQEIPFQWLLSDIDINSITYIPGFTYLDKNKSISRNSLLSISVPKANWDVADRLIKDEPIPFMASDSKRNWSDSLEWAEEEAEHIYGLSKMNFKTSSIKKNASETWVKKSINNYDIIHFATHSTSTAQFENDNTGIILYKDNLNDGFFSGNEISKLQLNGQMIFLSSCEGGIGEYVIGEGSMSLANAFLDAGASGVIASLWKVNDKAALDLSKLFYESYINDLSVSRSLYKAQKNYSQVHSSLKYPFVYISY